MRRILMLLALPTLLMAGSVVGESKHAKADLSPNGGSGVNGFVQITQLPKGGSNLVVHAHGLQPGKEYTSFYYESSDCTEPADALGSFVATPSGEGGIEGKIDDDVDEVGSVSVRLGPGYGPLQACARLH